MCIEIGAHVFIQVSVAMMVLYAKVHSCILCQRASATHLLCKGGEQQSVIICSNFGLLLPCYR